jgi:hypothetical protein
MGAVESQPLQQSEKYPYRSEREKMMEKIHKIGGIAALIGAATNLLGIGMYIFLAPKGYGSNDPGRVVAFLADNQAILRGWYVIIYLVFGLSLIFLSMALYERLKTGSPGLAHAVTIFGLIWAVLVIVMGTLSINDLGTVVKLYGENPTQAATVWLTLNAVKNGLGNNGGETMLNSLWFLLLSWAALRAGALPRGLNYLGLMSGAAGILSVVLQPALAMVYGVGLISWLVWLGIVMLRWSPYSTVEKPTPEPLPV